MKTLFLNSIPVPVNSENEQGSEKRGSRLFFALKQEHNIKTAFASQSTKRDY